MVFERFQRATVARLLLARIGGTAYSHVRGWLTDNTDSQDGKVISEHPRKENH